MGPAQSERALVLFVYNMLSCTPVTVAALCQEVDRNNHVGLSQPPRAGCPKTCKELLVGSVSCHHTIEHLYQGGGSNPLGHLGW